MGTKRAVFPASSPRTLFVASHVNQTLSGAGTDLTNVSCSMGGCPPQVQGVCCC